MTSQNEAAAGLVEGMPGVCDALDRAGMHILAKFCQEVAPTITTLLAQTEELQRERDEALDFHGQRAEERVLAAESRATAAEALVAEGVKVCEPFVEIRDQELSEMIKLIRKPVDGFALVSVSVTKRQFLDARSFIQRAKESRT